MSLTNKSFSLGGAYLAWTFFSAAVMAVNAAVISSTIPDGATNVRVVEIGPQGRYAFRYTTADGKNCVRNTPLYQICN